VVARLEYASRLQSATVTIDREAALFTVRPKRRRRVYVLPLADVAAFVVQRIIRAELVAKRAASRKRKGGAS
jgi:hypothetical protein